MFKDKTVFVVGAGASDEFNLPVGSMLAERIGKLLEVKPSPARALQIQHSALFSAWQHHFGSDHNQFSNHLDAAYRVSKGLVHSQSIDKYLYNHSNDYEAIFCGKTAIAYAILEAESKSIGSDSIDSLIFIPGSCSLVLPAHYGTSLYLPLLENR